MPLPALSGKERVLNPLAGTEYLTYCMAHDFFYYGDLNFASGGSSGLVTKKPSTPADFALPLDLLLSCVLTLFSEPSLMLVTGCSCSSYKLNSTSRG